ncbi:hypothetical protein JOB18_044363 [Solea senegalensis]|uniref:Thyroglobulin n=1 Tax=Solea senegalensis TaxID=28829 RepID=A0AAV6PXW3_SOLSE|nr:hypothetical protein JOB18_044363 [Solea senegalensis]
MCLAFCCYFVFLFFFCSDSSVMVGCLPEVFNKGTLKTKPLLLSLSLSSFPLPLSLSSPPLSPLCLSLSLSRSLSSSGSDHDCLSQRRLALSRLFSGPVALPPSMTSSPPASCHTLLHPLQNLLSLDADPAFLSRLVEVLHGLFPSVDGALRTLRRVAPGRLQEELFGGKFLTSAANFNLSGAVGSRGAVSVELLSSQKNRDLLQSVSRALEDPAFLSALRHTLTGLSGSLSLQQVLVPLLRYCTAQEQKYSAAVFVPSCTSSGGFQEVQCHSGDCWCVDPRGQEVTGSRTTGRQPRCPSRCERERAAALKVRGNMAAGAELYVPACSQDGNFLPLQCIGSRCFCVDTEGKTTAGPRGDTITCAGRTTPSVSGVCSQVLSEVTAFTEHVRRVVALSRSSHFPLGYGFLLAEGLRLNPDELHVGQSEEALQITDALLSRSRAALRLAAYSTVHMYLPPQRRSYQPYTPQCDASGNWIHTQCHHSTGQCWCVDEDGQYVANSLSSRSLRLPKCLSRCERAQAHSLLSGWTKASDITNVLPRPPQCEEDGRYSVLQTGGAVGSCVNPMTGEMMQTATQSTTGQLTCPSWCDLQGHQCRPDGSFVPLQCDVTSCWCVSVDGQEVGGTRTLQQTGQTPSCDRPLCPHPAVTYGALLCHPVVGGRQSCVLVCHHGYHNALPVSSFLCDSESGEWGGDSAPLSGACQISQPLQMMSYSQLWSLSSSCSQISSLQSLLFSSMTSRGLCSVQLPVSGSLVSVCDESSVRLQCDGDESLKLTVTWTVALSDLPTSDLPNLHDIVLFLNQSKRLEGVHRLLGNIKSTLVSTTTPNFSCVHGYHLTNDSEGCVVCPAGSYFREGACPLCPRGTYQEEEGRDHCNKCPRGSSPAGASSVNQCVTECQRRGLRCTVQGHFLSAQPDFLSGRWRCFNSEGAELEWTSSNKALTDEECSVLSRFQVVGSDLIIRAEDTDVLQTMTSDLRACLQACAEELRCHHVALFNSQTQCELYSTHTLNTHCTTSQQTTGFLGNPRAEVFDWLSCSMKVRGGASDLLVFRKTGAESSSRSVRTVMMKAVSGVFRTQVFSSGRSSLSDVHRFCQDGCSRDTCCHGFILNQNSLSGGSLLCGWLTAPSVLMCGDQDWDVIGHGKANRICGAGLTYNERQKSFVFNFGGQEFNITDSALSTDSKNKDYQSSIVTFQAVYLNADASSSDSGSSSCAAAEVSSSPDSSVQLKFASLSDDDVIVDPHRKLSALSFWLNKKNYDSQHALLWCLTRCDAESQCHIADLTEADSAAFFSCTLFPDTRVCGAYDKPVRRACRLLLDRAPNNTYTKTVDLSGPVKSFYQRISFQKMLSYSVRNRVSVTENNGALTQGFRECERRCDEDPCCRGFGFVRDTKSPGVVCVSLLSLGVLTCDEDVSSSWKPQDCRPSAVKSSPEPLGWYFKPVNQWTAVPALCPDFHLSPTNVSLSEWRLLGDSSILVDPSVSTYDVVHISRDVATDDNRTRDWCLHACQGAESCVAVSLSETEFATRCVLYPDTRACGLSSAPDSSRPASSCKLLIKEPAHRVYLRTEKLSMVTKVSIPGHGILEGVAVETVLNSERKSVVQYVGVPYARPPIGALRFEEAQPADWSGTWNATRPRDTCLQPGDAASDSSSEDCLYLNVFSPAAQGGRVPVLVFFFNPSANQSPALLYGSTLAALGNIVVVTANYRTAAMGFLSTGDSRLRGNYGLSDQEAVLRWVNKHISLMGGDNSQVTVGAERGGADIASLHLVSSSSPPLFHRMILMGGSIFSPALVDSASSSKRLTLDLASELGCVTSDLATCLRSAPADALNAAQTKLMAVSGPFRSWSPQRLSTSPLSYRGVDLLLGTSEHDGLIGRARRIKDFEVLQGRVDTKTAFYEALSRSLGGETGSERLKEAATWFYSLDHSPTPAGYNLFSRVLNNATRDLFITCPSLQMASFWANNDANVFLYHLPANSALNRADVFVPLDVQFAFGVPHHPISSQRFTSSDRRLSLAVMTYMSSFVRTGNPNPSQVWEESVMPRWHPVQSSESPPTYLEMSPALVQRRGLRERACSFWSHMGATLSREAARPRSESLTRKSRDTRSSNPSRY